MPKVRGAMQGKYLLHEVDDDKFWLTPDRVLHQTLSDSISSASSIPRRIVILASGLNRSPNTLGSGGHVDVPHAQMRHCVDHR